MVRWIGNQAWVFRHLHASTKWSGGKKNKTLITLVRAMLDDYGMPERFWTEAINTACHASNRVYPHQLLKKRPYELITGKKPNISYFRVFGYKCFIYKKKILGKFESRCDEGLFIGYASNSKSYSVFNQTSGLVEETCDVELWVSWRNMWRGVW